MARWDSPLFTVLWTDESPQNEDIWKAVTEGLVKPPNVGTQSVGQCLESSVSFLKVLSGTKSALRHASHIGAHNNGGRFCHHGQPVRFSGIVFWRSDHAERVVWVERFDQPPRPDPHVV